MKKLFSALSFILTTSFKILFCTILAFCGKNCKTSSILVHCFFHISYRPPTDQFWLLILCTKPNLSMPHRQNERGILTFYPTIIPKPVPNRNSPTFFLINTQCWEHNSLRRQSAILCVHQVRRVSEKWYGGKCNIIGNKLFTPTLVTVAFNWGLSQVLQDV